MYYALNQNPKVRAGQADLSSINACISGASPLHPKIKSDFEKFTGGKLIEGYGLSEAPTASHCNPLFGKNKTGSIGFPLPGVACKIVDLETGLKEIPVGEIGELIIRGPQVMSEYYNRPDENRIALRSGWLFTGDVAKMDDEGYFYIVDRKKDLIKVSGFQVWPNEVEGILNSHPDLEECAVGGVLDLEKGEKVVAWVVKKPNSLITENLLKDFCRKKIAGYKVPAEIQFIDKIPRTGVGKILRKDLILKYTKKGSKP